MANHHIKGMRIVALSQLLAMNHTADRGHTHVKCVCNKENLS